MSKKVETLFPTHFSQSVLSDVHKCEIYFFRVWVQKLIAEKNSHLKAGSLFASACEILRKSFYNDENSLDNAIEAGYNFILESEDTGDLIKSNDRLAFVFKKYFQKYPPDKSWKPILLVDGTYSIEYEFEFDTGIPHPDIPDRNIMFSGKLDLLAEKRLAGGRMIKAVVDEKTTNRVKRVEGTKVVDLAKEELSYLASGQIIGYAWAAQQLGVDVDLAYIRRVPVLTNYEPSFEVEVPITPFMIENWSKSTFNKIAELVERYKFYKETGDLFASFTPVFADACNGFNSSCNYKIGCIRKEGEESLIQTYKQLVIDPFTKEQLTLPQYKEKYSI